MPPIRRSSPRIKERQGRVTTTVPTTKKNTRKTRVAQKEPRRILPMHSGKSNGSSDSSSYLRNPEDGKVGRNENGDVEVYDDDGRNEHDDDSFVSTVEHHGDIEAPAVCPDRFIICEDHRGEAWGGDAENVGDKYCNDSDDDAGDLSVQLLPPLRPVRTGTMSMTSKTSEKSVTDNGGKRNKNYSELEDCLITKAYASVSVDPVHGSQQKGNIFWAKVHQKYRLLAAKEPGGKDLGKRPVDSIKQRYTKVIGKAVGKFNKYYKTLKNEPKSGWNEDDYIERAAEMYEEEDGKPFRFHSCVEVLHSVPKFDPMVSPNTATQSEKRSINNNHLPQGATMQRPIGTKKAKVVKYLQESGVIIGGDKLEDSVSHASSTRIEELLVKNYEQREKSLSLKRVQLYIQLNQMEKARELMDEIERMGGNNNEPAQDIAQAPAAVVQGNIRIPMPPGLAPPVEEIVLNHNHQVVESQITQRD